VKIHEYYQVRHQVQRSLPLGIAQVQTSTALTCFSKIETIAREAVMPVEFDPFGEKYSARRLIRSPDSAWFQRTA
jgi:hypothetical protein